MSRRLFGAAATTALLGVFVPLSASADMSIDATAPKASADTTPSSPGAGTPGRAVHIVVLFRSDCPPCRHELDILPNVAARYPDLAVTLVVLQDDGLLARKADALDIDNLDIRTVNGADREIMARYGDDRRGLPFTAAMDADGRICGRHYGLLGYDIVGRWRQAC